MRRLIFAAALAALLPWGSARAQAPSGVVAYEGARLIPGDGRPAIERAVLLVDGNRIREAGVAGRVAIPKNARRVDLSGKTLVPAFLNAHTHPGFQKGGTYARENYTREQYIQDLERAQWFGVAAVLSQGIDPGDIAPTIQADQRAGRAGGARLLHAGRGIGSPNAGPGAAAYRGIAYELNTPDQGRAAVRELAAAKVDVIKIWVDDRNGRAPRLSEPSYRAIIDEAHTHKLKVNAHVFYLSDLKALVDAGIDGLAHIARDLEIDDETVSAIVRRGVHVMPTLLTHERPTHTSLPPSIAAWLDGPAGRALGSALAARVKATFSGRTAEAVAQARGRYEILRRTVAKLARANARLMLGSDTGIQDQPFGVSEHLELEAMVDAGATPMQALVAATSTPAAYMGQRDLGTLTAGKTASFIVLDANPLDDIANTRRIADVYVDGRKLDRQAMLARLAP
jgi:imidazolonepropionase-like amidohydrolase